MKFKVSYVVYKEVDITFSQVEQYLTNRGWVKSFSVFYDQNGICWKFSPKLFNLGRVDSFRLYNNGYRLFESIQELANYEGRAVEEVLREMSNIMSLGVFPFDKLEQFLKNNGWFKEELSNDNVKYKLFSHVDGLQIFGWQRGYFNQGFQWQELMEILYNIYNRDVEKEIFSLKLDQVIVKKEGLDKVKFEDEVNKNFEIRCKVCDDDCYVGSPTKTITFVERVARLRGWKNELKFSNEGIIQNKKLWVCDKCLNKT